MTRLRMLLAFTLVVIGGTAPAKAADVLVAEGFALLDGGKRVDFRVPLNEAITFTNRSGGSTYRLVPHVVPGGRSVEFVIGRSESDDSREPKRDVVELAPGMSEPLGALGIPFELGFKGLSLAPERAAAPNTAATCIGCATSCGDWSVTCELCVSGWCCEVYCNGWLVCSICLLAV